jgi:hypothetical protein
VQPRLATTTCRSCGRVALSSLGHCGGFVDVDVSGDLRDRRGAPTSRSRVSRRRPWTRSATAGAGAHVVHELVAGVARPFASRSGPGAAAAFWTSSTAAAFHQAGRRPAARDV